MKSTSEKTRFSFLRFGLRFLLLMVFLTACVLGWVSWKIEAAKAELELADDLVNAGHYVGWNHSANGKYDWPEPGWNYAWLRNHWSSHISSLHLTNSELTSLESLEPLKHLTRLHVSSSMIADVEVLRQFPDLDYLQIHDCVDLTNIDAIGQCRKLKTLEIVRCESVEDISFISQLEDLEKLHLVELPQARVVDNLFANTRNLKELEIVGVDAIGDLDSLEAISSLESVNGLPRLVTLSFSSSRLKRIDFFDPRCSVVELGLGCKSLTDISGLSKLTKLKTLHLAECDSLESLGTPQPMPSVTKLTLISCPQFKSLAGIENLTGLRELILLKTGVSQEDADLLRKRYPNIQFDYLPSQ